MQNDGQKGKANEVVNEENTEMKFNSSVNTSSNDESLQFQDMLLRETKYNNNFNGQEQFNF